MSDINNRQKGKLILSLLLERLIRKIHSITHILEAVNFQYSKKLLFTSNHEYFVLLYYNAIDDIIHFLPKNYTSRNPLIETKLFVLLMRIICSNERLN